MISQQYRDELTQEQEVQEEKAPKKDADLANTLKSVERMLSLSPNEEVLRNLYDVIVANEGITENPEQVEQLNGLKVKIAAKLGDNLTENASAGATCAGAIAAIPNVIGSKKKNGKVKPIRRKLVGMDITNFMECMRKDIPIGLNINNHYFKTEIINETTVLTIDGHVVPDLDKTHLIKLVRNFSKEAFPVSVLESVVEPLDYVLMNKGLTYLSEDEKFDRSNEKNEIDDPQKDANLKAQIGKQNIASVENKDSNAGIKNTEKNTSANEEIKTNQEMVGVDDSDPQNKKYVIKDPSSGKISVKKQSEIEIQNEAFSHYRNKLVESELEETKASRFNHHLDNREQSFATISAERTNDNVRRRFGAKLDDEYEDNNDRENDPNYQKFIAFNHRRTKKLYKKLKELGVNNFIKMKGGFKELDDNTIWKRVLLFLKRLGKKGYIDNHEEDSVFVPNITLEQAIRLGKLFHQDSIMFKEAGSDKIKEYATNQEKVNDINSTRNQNEKIKLGDETGLAFVCCQGRTNNAMDKTYYSRPAKISTKFAFNTEDENGKIRTKKNSFFDRKFRNKPDEEKLYHPNSSYKDFDKG